MDKVIIEIQEISKKQAASKFREGELYWDINVKDGKTGRAGRAFGDWAKDWKLGDQVEVIWEKSVYKNPRTGVESESWRLKNPNEAPKPAGGWGNRGGSGQSSIVSAYMIAATLLAPQFVGKKVVLDYVTELANKIKPLIEVKAAEPAPAAPTAPTAPAPAPAAAAPVAEKKVVDTTPKATVEEDDFVEDEDKPF